MPRAAPRPCTYPGCGALVHDGSGRCVSHPRKIEARQTYAADRPTAAQRGYGGRWQRQRLEFLKEHPLCVACEAAGRVVLANVVDHRIPHRGDPVRFWDRGNWQALCKACHDQKTAREDGGFSNPRRGSGGAL